MRSAVKALAFRSKWVRGHLRYVFLPWWKPEAYDAIFTLKSLKSAIFCDGTNSLNRNERECKYNTMSSYCFLFFCFFFLTCCLKAQAIWKIRRCEEEETHLEEK